MQMLQCISTGELDTAFCVSYLTYTHVLSRFGRAASPPSRAVSISARPNPSIPHPPLIAYTRKQSHSTRTIHTNPAICIAPRGIQNSPPHRALSPPFHISYVSPLTSLFRNIQLTRLRFLASMHTYSTALAVSTRSDDLKNRLRNVNFIALTHLDPRPAPAAPGIPRHPPAPVQTTSPDVQRPPRLHPGTRPVPLSLSLSPSPPASAPSTTKLATPPSIPAAPLSNSHRTTYAPPGVERTPPDADPTR